MSFKNEHILVNWEVAAFIIKFNNGRFFVTTKLFDYMLSQHCCNPKNYIIMGVQKQPELSLTDLSYTVTIKTILKSFVIGIEKSVSSRIFFENFTKKLQNVTVRVRDCLGSTNVY